MIEDRPDLPCPWCLGRVRHLLGCPSPDDMNDKRWARQMRAHAVAVSYGDSEYGRQLMHLIEDPGVVADACYLLAGRVLHSGARR